MFQVLLYLYRSCRNTLRISNDIPFDCLPRYGRWPFMQPFNQPPGQTFCPDPGALVVTFDTRKDARHFRSFMFPYDVSYNLNSISCWWLRVSLGLCPVWLIAAISPSHSCTSCRIPHPCLLSIGLHLGNGVRVLVSVGFPLWCYRMWSFLLVIVVSDGSGTTHRKRKRWQSKKVKDKVHRK